MRTESWSCRSPRCGEVREAARAASRAKAKEAGGGFGVMARPVGAYVIRGDQVEWRPAIDTGRLAMAGLVLAGLAVSTVRTAIKARTKKGRS